MQLTNTFGRALAAGALALAAAGVAPALAQTVGTTIPAGTAPYRIAINPVTNRLYVTNEGSNALTVINATTGAASTVAIGARPLWLGVNPETNKVYVAQFGNNTAAPHLVVVNGATNAVTSNVVVGDVGWIAINPVTNKVYTVRYGHTDEYTVTQDESFVLA